MKKMIYTEKSDKSFLKWFLEVANQEYKGDVKLLKSNMSIAGEII